MQHNVTTKSNLLSGSNKKMIPNTLKISTDVESEQADSARQPCVLPKTWAHGHKHASISMASINILRLPHA